jgi:uncharacterized coiled-coil protein SlyX
MPQNSSEKNEDPLEPTQEILDKVDTQEKVIEELNKSLHEPPKASVNTVQDFVELIDDSLDVSTKLNDSETSSKFESCLGDIFELSQTFVDLLNSSKVSNAETYHSFVDSDMYMTSEKRKPEGDSNKSKLNSNDPQEPTQEILQKVDTQEKVISELNKSLRRKSPKRSTKNVQDFIELLNDTATPIVNKKPSKLESVFEEIIDLSQTFVDLLNKSKTGGQEEAGGPCSSRSNSNEQEIIEISDDEDEVGNIRRPGASNEIIEISDDEGEIIEISSDEDEIIEISDDDDIDQFSQLIEDFQDQSMSQLAEVFDSLKIQNASQNRSYAKFPRIEKGSYHHTKFYKPEIKFTPAQHRPYTAPDTGKECYRPVQSFEDFDGDYFLDEDVDYFDDYLVDENDQSIPFDHLLQDSDQVLSPGNPYNVPNPTKSTSLGNIKSPSKRRSVLDLRDHFENETRKGLSNATKYVDVARGLRAHRPFREIVSFE